MAVELKSLFWKTHLDLDQSSILLALKLAIWTPFGIILLVSRLLGSIFILAALMVFHILFPSVALPLFVRKLLLLFIGIRIRGVNGTEHVAEAKKIDPTFIVACNHRTAFDILPFAQFTPLAVMMDASFFDSHALSRWFLKVVKKYLVPVRVQHYAGTEEAAREAQRNNIIDSLRSQGKPLFYFPEGWDTNGLGLLRYQKFMFSLGKPVVPAALSVKVGLFAPLRPGMLGSSILREILWLFFSPYYDYQITLLAPIVQGAENEMEFALRAQRLTAVSLGVPATAYTKADALTYRRSLLKPKAD